MLVILSFRTIIAGVLAVLAVFFLLCKVKGEIGRPRSLYNSPKFSKYVANYIEKM